jgi:hypothetical protein
MAADPLTGRQRLDERTIEFSCRSVVEVLDRGGRFQMGLTQARGIGPVLPPQVLGVDEQSQTLFEAEAVHLGIFQLCLKRIGQAVQLKTVEFVEGLLARHDVTSFEP